MLMVPLDFLNTKICHSEPAAYAAGSGAIRTNVHMDQVEF